MQDSTPLDAATRGSSRLTLSVILALAVAGCSPTSPVLTEPPPTHPAILLVTLDTTRADALGFENDKVRTPHLEALAARGVRFSQAYTTVPTTLPAHASIMTGLYPADHGIHENARTLANHHTLLGDLLRQRGYSTAAFVSALPLSSQFGLARAFDHYDDDFGASSASGHAAERSAGETTERALDYLNRQPSTKPLFLWVHYFDPHEPYAPPEPFRSQYPEDPYLGEIAYMDQELGRLLAAFEGWSSEGPYNILIAGDHGEGRGDHGEALHGNLLYQGVLRVPLFAAGTGISPTQIQTAVSIRRIFDTILGWTGEQRPNGLLSGTAETVLAEAMKPNRQYGWQPQVMAVRDHLKVIRSGEVEVFDLRTDPAETRNLAGEIDVAPELREAIRAYAERSLESREAEAAPLSQEDQERLASLGYVGWEGRPTLRAGAPNPKDMVHLFAALDYGSGLFVNERYDEAIEVFEDILKQDPHNLMIHVRLAVAHSISGREDRALELFERARSIDPSSVDVRHYLALHYFRSGRWQEAAALLTSVLAQMPHRLPALESLAQIREGQERIEEASGLLERIVALQPTNATRWTKLGEMRMALGDTEGAIGAFEQARESNRSAFSHVLELGVLYLADRRLTEAAECLDLVPASHPGYAMALFKRAQVSVLLGESDQSDRIRLATQRSDATTRRLIENETLFRNLAQP